MLEEGIVRRPGKHIPACISDARYPVPSMACGCLFASSLMNRCVDLTCAILEINPSAYNSLRCCRAGSGTFATSLLRAIKAWISVSRGICLAKSIEACPLKKMVIKTKRREHGALLVFCLFLARQWY